MCVWAAYVGGMQKRRILYLQLPLLDNDTQNTRENFAFAGAYLDHALGRSEERAYYDSAFAPTAWDELDTHHLAEAILADGAAVVVCTLYLWNIERTLRLGALLKEKNPAMRLMVGGPESAREHPLLFQKESPFDAVITGEGEAVFPELLRAWRLGETVDFENVVLNTAVGWVSGKQAAPVVDLFEAQPDEAALMRCVQNRPVVYVETVRGCPLTCSYCRYYQLHTGLRMLSAEQVVARIRRFRELGATEIRFVDPTFNARSRFTAFLEALVALNRDQRLSFFAEIRSDTLTPRQAELMKAANFTAVEVGVQSIDLEVLAKVARPVRLEQTAAGIRALCEAGVQVVLDVMYGLPGQTLQDVRQSLEWGLAFGENVQVQCMQTLVLPGTVLRAEAETWDLVAGEDPPYAIQQTGQLVPEDIQEIEIFLDDHPDLPADPVTPRFCGERLRGLFKAQHRISAERIPEKVPGRVNRRALLIHGADLFSHRDAIDGLIDRAISEEPDGLWQFVLVVEQEEPLDLIDHLVAAIQRHPPHLLDRFASAAAFGLIVSRRLYVRTKSGMVSDDWKEAAEELLRQSFG